MTKTKCYLAKQLLTEDLPSTGGVQCRWKISSEQQTVSEEFQRIDVALWVQWATISSETQHVTGEPLRTGVEPMVSWDTISSEEQPATEESAHECVALSAEHDSPFHEAKGKLSHKFL
ncbi:hypothetical protein M514_02999 [Trichuris suis]|uniref:Uncharacterized protein n=1 Tax=Trichuris suis TaxID=68888 RepID=A0A085MG75_9BILA|nr:hypothetical protein M513_02999 [Trichuris suis]KFD69117.1 hypothetical protein M514_02999 [Trichuris suis]KHJ43831.1 hypothetical protein D918_05883 [Trichuris suis]